MGLVQHKSRHERAVFVSSRPKKDVGTAAAEWIIRLSLSSASDVIPNMQIVFLHLQFQFLTGQQPETAMRHLPVKVLVSPRSVNEIKRNLVYRKFVYRIVSTDYQQ